MSRARPEVAEAVGAFVLVLAGCGAVVANAATGALGHVGVALAFTFTVAMLVYALGHVCGAHFNPAVTVAFAVTGHFPWRRVPSYVAAQVIGATLASFVLRALFGLVGSVGTTVPAGDVVVGQAFAVEALATFVLAFVIVGVATDKRAAPGVAGVAIGLAVGVGALFAGPWTGGSMNPARTLGPALAAGVFDALWVYVTAPVVGAVVAMALYEWLRPAGLGVEARAPVATLDPVEDAEVAES